MASIDNILDNDFISDGSQATVDNTSVELIDPTTGLVTTTPDIVTVLGEGVWNYNPLTGEITFTPEAGFTGDPADIQYKLTETNTGLSATAAINLEYVVCPVTFAGDDDDVCEGETIYLSSATASNYDAILWTTSGTGTFSDNTVVNPVYTASQSDINNGFVILSITASSENGCESAYDEVIWTIIPGVTVNAGSDDEICSTTPTYSLIGASAADHISLEWTTSGTGTFSSSDVLNPVYTPSLADEANGSVELLLTASSSGTCSSASDAMMLTITTPPTADAGANDYICEGNDYTLSGSGSNYASVLWSTSGTGSFDDNNALIATYTPSPSDLIDGSVLLTITAVGQGSCYNVIDDMTLSFVSVVEITVGDDDEICSTDGEYQIAGIIANDYESLLWTTTGDGTFSDETAEEPVYYPGTNDLSGTVVTLTLTGVSSGSCGEANDSFDLQVSPEIISTAGPNDVICAGNNYQVVNASADNYSSVVWSSTGSGFFEDATIINPVYYPSNSDINDGQVLLTMTVEALGSCDNSMDAMVLFIIDSAIADAGENQDICSYELVYLDDASADNYESIAWVTNGDGSFSNSTILNPIYYPGQNDIDNGIIELTLIAQSYGDVCPDAQDQMSVIISPEAIAFAGNDQIICEGAPCFIADAYAENYSSVMWTSSLGGLFNDPTIVNPTYTPSPLDIINGYALLTLTVSGEGTCESVSDQIILSITPGAEANAGYDASICQTETYYLQYSTASNYASLLWTTDGTGTLSDATSLNPVYTPGANESGLVTMTLTAYGYGSCPDATDSMELTIFDAASVDAGSDGLICEGSVYTLVDALADGYSSLQWTTSGTGTFDNAGMLHATYTPSPNDILDGYATLTLTGYSEGTCADAVDAMTLNISRQAIVDAGVNAEICEGSVYDITTATATFAQSLLWTTTGSGTFDDATLLNPVYTPGVDETGELIFTLTATSAAPCSTVSDVMILDITPMVEVDAGIDATICEGTAYELSTATASNYGSVLWTTSGTGTFNDATLVNAIYTPSINDIHDGFVELTISATGLGSCPDDSDLMTLSITPGAEANAGYDASICQTETYYLQYSTASNYASLLWTTDGTGTLSDATSLNPVYTPGANESGLVTMTLTAYGYGSCPDATDSMELTIFDAASVDAGSDGLICEGSVYTLVDALADGYSSLQWTTSGTGTFDNAGMLHATYTPSPNDILDGYATLTLTGYSEGTCADAVDAMTLNISRQAIVDAGVNAEICEGSVYDITTATATFAQSLLWTTTGSGTFDDATLLNPVYTPGVDETGELIFTLTATSAAPCSTVSDVMILDITPMVEVDAGIDATICEGTAYELSTATASNYGSVLWTTSGTGTFNDATLVNATYTPSENDLIDGFVDLTITSYGLGSCPDIADVMTLFINESAFAFAGDDDHTCGFSPYSLTNATASSYDSLVWTTTGFGVFNDNTIVNPVYTPDVTDPTVVELKLFVYAVSSCSNASDVMFLTREEEPNAYAGEDTAICEGSSYFIADATASDFSVVLWTTSGTGAFDDPNVINATYTPSAADILNGSVVLTLTAASIDFCPDATDSMTLSISGSAVANAGSDAAICQGEFFTISTATAQNYQSVLWTSTGGGSFNDPTIVNPTYIPAAGETGIITMTMTLEGVPPCGAAVDAMTLTISPEASAYAGVDAQICMAQTYIVNDAWAQNYASVLWISNGVGDLLNANTLTPTYVAAAGEYGSVQLTLTAIGQSGCDDATDNMIILIHQPPVANAGPDAMTCQQQPYTVIGAYAEYFTSLYWESNGVGELINSGTLAPTYIPAEGETGNVILTMFVSGNSACGNATDQAILTIAEPPTVDAGDDDATCSTDPYTIVQANAENYSSVVWSTSGNGVFDDPYTLNPVYTPGSLDAQAGAVTLTITVDGIANCPDASDAMILTVYPVATAVAGIDAEICEGGSYTVNTAMASDYSSLQWTTNGLGTIMDAQSLYPTYIPANGENGDVILTLTAFSYGNCDDATDEMTLTITPAPIAFAGDDAEICEGDVYEIPDASAANYTDYEWFTNGDGILMDENTLSPIYVPANGETGVVTITLAVAGLGSCEEVSDDLRLTITPAPVAFAGYDAVTCGTTQVIVESAFAENYATFQWSSDGLGTLENTNTFEPVYTPVEGESGLVTITLTVTGNGACSNLGTVSDDMFITIRDAAYVDAGVDIVSCENDPVQIDASIENAASIAWTTTGDGVFDDNSIEDPVYTPGSGDLNNGVVTLTVTAEGISPCGEVSDEVILTIDRVPVINAGGDDFVCEGDVYALNPQAELYSSILWTTSGDGVFDDFASVNAVYTPGSMDIANGFVTLTLTGISGGSCDNVSDDMLLTIVASSIAFAGDDAVICETDNYTISDANAEQYEALLWSSSGTGTFDDATSLNPTYYPSESDLINGSLILTLEVSPIGNCSGASDEMTLTFQPVPVVSAGIDPEICSDDVYVIIGASASDYSAITWTTLGDGMFDDPQIMTPVYTPGTSDVLNETVDVVLTAAGLNGCENVSDTATLIIHQAPVIDAGTEIVIDQFTSADLLVTASGGSESFSFFWYPEEYVDFPDISNPSTVILQEDLVMYVRVTDNVFGCQSVDSLSIIIDPVSTEIVNAIDDIDTTIVNVPITIDILFNDYNPMDDILNVEIGCYPQFGAVELNFDKTITYTPDEGYTGNDTLCYVVCEALRPNVCDTAYVYIYVRPGNLEEDLTIYNGFTPNMDGYNDYFYIMGLESYPENLLIIFNRWGDEVNRFENYNNTSVRWEGDNKRGEPLPDGTYFYILEIQGYDPVQGWVLKQSSH